MFIKFLNSSINSLAEEERKKERIPILRPAPAGKNLLLTMFRQSWQLLGRHYSWWLPRQVVGKFQIQVNMRLLPFRIVTLYT